MRVTQERVLQYYADLKREREHAPMARAGDFVQRVVAVHPRSPSRGERAAVARGDWWAASPITNRQRALCVDLGITPPDCRGEAHDLIRSALGVTS